MTLFEMLMILVIVAVVIVVIRRKRDRNRPVESKSPVALEIEVSRVPRDDRAEKEVRRRMRSALDQVEDEAKYARLRFKEAIAESVSWPGEPKSTYKKEYTLGEIISRWYFEPDTEAVLERCGAGLTKTLTRDLISAVNRAMQIEGAGNGLPGSRKRWIEQAKKELLKRKGAYSRLVTKRYVKYDADNVPVGELLNTGTVENLKALAADLGVKVNSRMRKKDIIEAIEEGMTQFNGDIVINHVQAQELPYYVWSEVVTEALECIMEAYSEQYAYAQRVIESREEDRVVLVD